MKIVIVGMGYVGVVSAACLARDGHEVVGVDINPDKLTALRRGDSPIVEPGLQELVASATASGRLRVSESLAGAVAGAQVVFVCVGTPSRPGGDQDLTAVTRVMAEMADLLKDRDEPPVLVVRSTVKPGTTWDVLRPILEKRSGKSVPEEIPLCFQPEFLREGSSIRDYDHPPFTIIGAARPEDAEPVASLFRHLQAPVEITDVPTAEMVKYACNAFHALKVAFANEIGRVSHALGVNPHKVMDLLCMDRRLNISPAYLRPGFAFGGSCLPKDLRALTFMASRSNVSVPLLQSILQSNELHLQSVVDAVLSHGRKRIGLIGLTFKSGTDDLRESPLVALAERILGKGLPLRIVDPNVELSSLIGANRRFIETAIPHLTALMTRDVGELMGASDVVVLGLNDPVLRDAMVPHCRPDHVLYDLVGLPDRSIFPCEVRGACW